MRSFKMKKMLAVVLMIITAGIAGTQSAHGQSPRAVIRELRGTVETKAPGASAWRVAAVGEELEKETMVSTGFKSEAVLDLGNSTLRVRPLTRLSLEELAGAANSDRIGIQLRTGRIRADVKPPAGGKVDFRVQSPIATASVRGTVFDFDTVNLSVAEGTVSFAGVDNTVVYVAAGQSSSPDPLSGRTAAPVEAAVAGAPPPPAGVE
ncbi:MAG: FecR family protein, partial [Treponema sp.]|nr:FecR family protein [Treponema sp.]